MIDSHSTLTNLNDNLNNDSSGSSKRLNEDNNEEGPVKKQVRLSPFDHGSITKVVFNFNMIKIY
jgi:hypothetical protein